jgi:O-antigen/teichoic acid export membrane protein
VGRPGRVEIHVPLREIASYTMPLLTMDLVLVAMGALDGVLLGYFHGTGPVGALRVVESAARMNSLVFQSFAILFVPLAARYFARDDRAGARDLYWRTAAWMAVLSFPIFTLTFSMSDAVTVLLYEERYRSSAILLAMLALGRYVDAAFGANGQMLRIFGGIRETVAVNLATFALHVVLALVLIPPLEAFGAALAVLLTYVAYNGLKQFALNRVTGIPIFDPHYASLYVAIVAVAAGLAVVDAVTSLPFVVDLAMAGTASLVVLAFGRRHLRIAETFPELRRIPLARWLG